MARAGMSNLISQLRAMCSAGSADTTLAGVTYWTDDQLQTELDATQVYRTGVALVPVEIFESGTWRWYDYLIPDTVGAAIEEAGTGSPFKIKDSTGATVSASGYSVNYRARRITFTADQQNQPRYLDVAYYNLNLAAASVWNQKAAFVAANFDFETDNQNLKSSQEYRQCKDMAKYYRGKAGVKVGRFVRSDENTFLKPTWNGIPIEDSNR